MTLITGQVSDVGMNDASGVLYARAAEFRGDGQVVVTTAPATFAVTDGEVSAEVAPGPTIITLNVGPTRKDWFVNVPESNVGLGDLIATYMEYKPAVVSAAIAARDAARDAAVRAESAQDAAEGSASDAAGSVSAAGVSESNAAQSASDAAGSASAAAGSASAAAGSAATASQGAQVITDNLVAIEAAPGHAQAAQVARQGAEDARDAAAGSASAASGSASDSAQSATVASGSASDAAGSASAAAGSAGNAASSASAAEGSASDAADAVVDARAARDAAEGHASSAADSASAAAGSATDADVHAGRAETAAAQAVVRYMGADEARVAAETAASTAEDHRAHVDSIRDTLDEAAQSNVAPYLTQTALNATYGTKAEVQEVADAVEAVPAPPKNTGVLGGLSLLADSTGRGTWDGDSEPPIGGTTTKVEAMTWFTWATRLSRGRLSRGVNASVIGDTLAMMQARVQADVINHPRAVGTAVIVCSGYNDAFFRVPTETYMAQYAAIHQALDGAQMEMIACTPLPTANGADINARLADYSDAIRAYAKKHGLFLLDLRALTIHTDGGLIPSVAQGGDGVHPRQAGHFELGKLVHSALRKRLPKFGPHPVTLWGARGNLTTNRTFEGTPDAAGRPPGIFAYGASSAAVVPSVVPGGGLIEGNWFRMTLTASEQQINFATRITPVAGKVEVGDRIAIAGIAAVSGGVRFSVTPVWGGAPFEESAIRTVNVSFGAVPFYAEFTVPPTLNATNLDITIQTGKAGTVSTGVIDIAQLSVYNLTKNPMLGV